MQSEATNGKDTEEVHNAKDVVYVRQLGFALGLLGSWPKEGQGANAMQLNRMRRMSLMSLLAAICPFIFGTMYFVGGDVRRMGHMVLTYLLGFVLMTKSLLTATEKYWLLIDQFLEDIHLLNHKHRNEYFYKEHIAVHARCHTLWRSMVAVLALGVILYNVQPVYVNTMSGAYSGADVDYEYSVYFVVPHYDLQRDFGPHVFIAIWNIWMSVWAVSAIWLPDLFSMKVVMHIGGHMRVLGNEMKRFTEDLEKAVQGRSQFNDQESATAKENLKYFVNRHRQILSYVSATNETFSAVYFFYFMYFQVALCIMMWECSQGKEGLVQYGILTASSVFSLSLLCVVMEMITTENDALERGVYALPWQLMRVPERRTVLLMLMRVQSPLRMKALGLTDIGVSTMAAILRTSTSYFMFLKSKA